MGRLNFAIVITIILGYSGHSKSQDANFFNQTVESRVCPRNPVEYQTARYSDQCQALMGSNSTSTNLALLRCQNDVDRLNQAILRYNDFMRQCQRRR